MKHVLALMLLLIGAASASPSQKSVKEKFQAVITAETRAFIDQILLKHADHPDVTKLRRQLENEIGEKAPKELKSFDQEFATTDAEAVHLLSNGPDKLAAVKAIRSNMEKLKQHGAPTPALPGFMIKKFIADPDQDPWFLESLKRLTTGLVRKAEQIEKAETN